MANTEVQIIINYFILNLSDLILARLVSSRFPVDSTNSYWPIYWLELSDILMYIYRPTIIQSRSRKNSVFA